MGTRIKKEGRSGTTVYVGKYYEKNVTTGVETFYYYLGGRLVAYKHDGDLRYVFQDHLGSTALVTNVNGALVYEASYDPWGNVRTSTGTLDMDRSFTGQRFDSATGLYYHNARYGACPEPAEGTRLSAGSSRRIRSCRAWAIRRRGTGTRTC